MRRGHPLPIVAWSVALVSAMVLSLAGCGGASREMPAIRTSASDTGQVVYVALGDSYTSAPRVGLELQRACRRTVENYPHLLAASWRAQSAQRAESVTLVDVSCGGATVANLTSPQKPTVARQLDAVRRDADVVTVAVGGNDVGIMPVVMGCLTAPAVCERRTTRSLARMRTMRNNLVAALRRVQQRAPNARIVVVGYPEIVPRTGRCLKAGRAQVRQARTVLDRIATAQRTAARQVGATFVDLRTATRGHGLCTAKPWIAWRTTATSLKFHPKAAEQRAAARAIEDALQNQPNG